MPSNIPPLSDEGKKKILGVVQEAEREARVKSSCLNLIMILLLCLLITVPLIIEFVK